MRDFTTDEMIEIENALEELIERLEELDLEDALDDVVYMYELDEAMEEEVKRLYDEQCSDEFYPYNPGQ